MLLFFCAAVTMMLIAAQVYAGVTAPSIRVNPQAGYDAVDIQTLLPPHQLETGSILIWIWINHGISRHLPHLMMIL